MWDGSKLKRGCADGASISARCGPGLHSLSPLDHQQDPLSEAMRNVERGRVSAVVSVLGRQGPKETEKFEMAKRRHPKLTGQSIIMAGFTFARTRIKRACSIVYCILDYGWRRGKDQQQVSQLLSRLASSASGNGYFSYYLVGSWWPAVSN